MLSEVAALNAKLKTVAVAFGANIVFTECDTVERRAALSVAFDRVLALAGSDFHFFRVDGTNHEWDGKKPERTFATIRKKLARSGSYKTYTFFCAKEDAYEKPATLSVYAHANYTVAPEGIATFGFTLPFALFERRRAEVEAIFYETCVALDADQGHAGPTVVDRGDYYFDGERLHDAPRKREVARLLARHRGLDLLYVDAVDLHWVDYGARYTETQQRGDDLAWGLRWPAWSTYIGRKWVAKLGATALRRALAGLTAKVGPRGVLVVSGEPSLDGRGLATVAKATKPVRLRARFAPGHTFLAELSRPAANRWVERFD